MTLTMLEYVIARHLGEPDRSDGQGESYWECPRCGKGKFHTLPDLEGQKHRFSCFSCGFWGDGWDFLKEQYPREGWSARQLRMSDLESAYVDYLDGRDGEAMPVRKKSKKRGSGLDHEEDLREAWVDLNWEERWTLTDAYPVVRRQRETEESPPEESPASRLLASAGEIFARRGLETVTLEGLARQCYEFRRWQFETDARHWEREAEDRDYRRRFELAKERLRKSSRRQGIP